MSAPGLTARLAVEPTGECPFWNVAADLDVLSTTPAPVAAPPQVVLGESRETVAARPELRPVVATEETVVCELPALAGDGAACDHDRCLARGVDWLPVAPFERHYDGGRVVVEVATAEESLVRATMGELEAVGFDVTVERITAAGEADGARLVVVDRGVLTARQREVASLAVERGYFDPDGTAAGDLADELGVSKATVSEHLRAVQRKIGKQVFRPE